MADHSQRALALKVDALTAKNALLQEQLEIAKNAAEVARRQAAEEVEMTRRHAKEMEAIATHRESIVQKNFDHLLEVADLGSGEKLQCHRAEDRVVAHTVCGDTHQGTGRCQKLGIKDLLDPSILTRILSSLDVLGEWRTLPMRRALSATCRDFANVGAYREGDLVIVSHVHMPGDIWRAAQFTVNDTDHFSLAVQVTGYWNTKDTFRLGVASAALPLAGEDGHQCGYWLSPKSGFLVGQDRSRHFLTKLRADCPIPGASGLLRNSKGVVHGDAGEVSRPLPKAKGGRATIDRAFRGVSQGKGPRSIALACRLLPGSVWILEFRRGVVEFFCAEAANQPIESLGIADFCCCGPPVLTDQADVGNAPAHSLPVENGGYHPSILYRVAGGSEELVEVLHRGKGKGREGIGRRVFGRGRVRNVGFNGDPHYRTRGGLKHVGLEVLWAKSVTRALLGCTPAEICNKADSSSGDVVVFRAAELPGYNLTPNVFFAQTSFLLREVRVHWAYWEALPLTHDPGTADFSVAVLLEGEWRTWDRFRLGVIPVGRPLWSDRKVTRVVRHSRGKHLPESPQIAFGLDPLSGVWVREGMPLGYQSWPEGLCERDSSDDERKGKGKGKGRNFWLRRNMRGIQKGKGSAKGMKWGRPHVKCGLVSGHVWAMRHSEGNLSFYHGESTDSVNLIGVALAPQQSLQEDEQKGNGDAEAAIEETSMEQTIECEQQEKYEAEEYEGGEREQQEEYEADGEDQQGHDDLDNSDQFTDYDDYYDSYYDRARNHPTPPSRSSTPPLPQPEIPRLNPCDGGYCPVLWVRRMEDKRGNSANRWDNRRQIDARLRIIRMPIVIG